MLFFKKEKTYKDNKVFVTRQFSKTIETINCFCDCEDTIEKKIVLMNFAIDTIKTDLQYELLSEMFCLERLFDHIYTDGYCWYNSYNNKEISKLWDYRIGVIFETAKTKFKLEQSIPQK